MPKFKTERIWIKDPNSREVLFDFKIDVLIDSEGVFYCNMPEAEAKRLEDAGVKMAYNSRTKRNGSFYARTYDDLVRQVKTCFEVFTTKTLVKSELVIKYQIQTTCSYAMHEDQFLPGPGTTWELLGKSADDLGVRWRNGTRDTHAQNPSPFGFMLWTCVYKKNEYSFVGRENKIEYEVQSWHSDIDNDVTPELWWLSRIVSVCRPEHESKDQEIPATEENAAFFNTMYKYIFGINEKIAFLAKKENLMQFIESNKQLLLS